MAYRGQFDPLKDEAYKISRSGIEFFINCPHCFYLDRRLGVKQPSGPPFSLNSAVNHLLLGIPWNVKSEGLKYNQVQDDLDVYCV